MKTVLQQLYKSTNYTNILYWGKIASITGFAQMLVQGMGLLCGILVIRLLSTHEYALYTLTNTMLGTMTVLADGGISSGVMAQGGKVWKDKQKLGLVLATGLALRKKFAIKTLIVAIPSLLYLLMHHNASLTATIFIIISIIPTFYAALSDSLLEIVPKLYQNIKPLQQNQIIVSINRLLLSGIALFIFPFTFLAIISSGLPRIIGNIRLRKIASEVANYNQEPDLIIKGEILKIVKKTLPGSIYYCISGQIITWLVSIFGNTSSIAQIGALGRLSMILNIFSISFGALIIPRFARLPNIRLDLIYRFWQIIICTILFCSCITGLVWLCSTPILILLGNKYIGLDTELLLSIIAGVMNLISGLCFGLCSSRGWVINPIILILGNLISIISGIFLFNILSLIGVLLFGIFINITPVIINGSYCLYKILKIR